MKKGLHMPQMDTILIVEKAILDADHYLRRMELHNSLPKQVQYQTFMQILDYLEAHGLIIFNDKEIVYTGINNPKLQELIDTSVLLKSRK